MMQEDALPIGKMVWGTYYNSQSYFGYKPDILKSGVQKYLRRREEKKMLWCIAELYLFKFVHPDAKKAILSNLLNRLIVMLDEEVLFTEWNKYLIVRELIEKFEENDRSDFLILVKITKIMVGAEMLRLTSDIAGYFKYGMQLGGVTPPTSSPTALKTSVLISLPGDDAKMLEEMGNFIELFVKKDHNCFYWMFKIVDRKKTPCARRFRRQECAYIIWNYIIQYANGNNFLKKCIGYRLKEYFKKQRKERTIFLTASVMLVMHADKIDWSPVKMKFAEQIKADKSDNIRIFKNREKLIFDDYVIDMHCSLGREQGKNKIDFIATGAVVVNENKQWYVKEWRDIYNGCKIKSFHHAVESRKQKVSE